MDNWDYVTEVLIVGSGAGALTAACRAADSGCDVLVVEKAEYYGGTSASSGGGLWIPNNHLMQAAGIDDSEEEAVAYISALTGKDVAPEVVDAFVSWAPIMLRYLEDETEAAFEAMVHYADYYQELEGAKPGGRSIDPLPYHAGKVGPTIVMPGEDRARMLFTERSMPGCIVVNQKG